MFAKIFWRERLALCLQLVFLVSVTVQNDMCGLPAPDPAKTCISVRLPWNPAPMYFCTDKSTFRYRNQCQNRFGNNQCGLQSIRQDVLMVASPWDCCPLVSYPDSCVNQQCPPPPMNRKCQTMEPNPSQPWECCNSYFCEENMTPDTCHFKRLEPTCNTPPQGKMNCVAFGDPFGCCPKFQCDGEGKPGHCPAQADAMKFMARFNSSFMMGPGMPMMGMGMNGMMNMGMNMGMGGASAMAGVSQGSPAGQAEMHLENKPAEGAPPAAPAPPPEGEAAAPPPPPPAERQGAMARPVASGAFVAIPGGNQNMIACIGDANCPGTMKCCSSDMNVYVMDSNFLFRNRNPTYGYCTEPMMNTNTKTLKYVSQ